MYICLKTKEGTATCEIIVRIYSIYLPAIKAREINQAQQSMLHNSLGVAVSLNNQ
jgi:hypothetical protein